MAIKELKKITNEKEIENFIAQGGLPAEQVISEEDHHLLLRMPKWLLEKIDIKRKKRVGKISRNLWILETIDRATKK